MKSTNSNMKQDAVAGIRARRAAMLAARRASGLTRQHVYEPAYRPEHAQCRDQRLMSGRMAGALA